MIEVRDGITCPYPNFIVEIWEWISYFVTLYNAHAFLSMPSMLVKKGPVMYFIFQSMRPDKPYLTHWCLDKMAAISQTTFSIAFSWMKNVRILIEFSLKFGPKGPINNIPALVQIMAWRRPGDKPLSEPVMVSLLTHICVTRPQWVNTLMLRQYCSYCADDVFKYTFLNENVWISFGISVKFELT